MVPNWPLTALPPSTSAEAQGRDDKTGKDKKKGESRDTGKTDKK